MKWDEGLLGTLLIQMEASVRQHLKEGEEATGEVLSLKKWRAVKVSNGRFYAVSGHRMVSMHRLILGIPPGACVDHKDGDGLNNRRINLRAATYSQNGINRGRPRNNTSGFKGVTRHSRTSKFWKAGIEINRKTVYLGRFQTAEEAARAYDSKAYEVFGEFAVLNFARGVVVI
jgi:hypothetical protein